MGQETCGIIMLKKKEGEWDYVHDEIISRISGLAVECPECETIIHSDDQYQCGTCGGSGQINVLSWANKQIIFPSKKGVIMEAENRFSKDSKIRKFCKEVGFIEGCKWIIEKFEQFK